MIQLFAMYIAIDIGGTKTLIAAFSAEGEVLDSKKYPTNKNFDDFMVELVSSVEEISKNQPITAISVAAPALINHDQQIAVAFGNLNWQNVDIVSPLKYNFTDLVFIENDAKLGALGEANLGAGRDHDTVLYVTISTGIGTGITKSGRLDETLINAEGGMMEFAHGGHLERWEKFASGKAFYEKYKTFGSDDNNPDHWREWSKEVAIGLLNLISIIQPDVVVIGGSMGNHIAKYHDFLYQDIQDLRGPTVKMPIIVGAEHPDEAVINGCYVLCKQRIAEV